MANALGLPDALKRRGLTVEVVPGWEARSAGSFNPKGAVCHWTAGPRGTTARPSLGIVTKGRPDLPGPLCNVYLDRRGVAVVVAAGRANHAGTGGWRGLVGNSAVFGTEAEAAGPDDWTDAQRWAYPRVNAAYCDLGRFGADMVCGHSEWAGPRKTDINNYPMTAMRAQVAAILNGEDDDMPSVEEIWNFPINGVNARDRLLGVDSKTEGIGGQVWAENLNGVRARDRLIGVDSIQLPNLAGQVAGLQAAITAIAQNPGTPVDLDAVFKAAQDGARSIVDNLRVVAEPEA